MRNVALNICASGTSIAERSCASKPFSISLMKNMQQLSYSQMHQYRHNCSESMESMLDETHGTERADERTSTGSDFCIT